MFSPPTSTKPTPARDRPAHGQEIFRPCLADGEGLVASLGRGGVQPTGSAAGSGANGLALSLATTPLPAETVSTTAPLTALTQGHWVRDRSGHRLLLPGRDRDGLVRTHPGPGRGRRAPTRPGRL